nr:uncharacterized protein LOC109187050 [Ipomoea batatas]
MSVYSFPTNVKNLLSTGIFEGVPVKYVSWSRGAVNAYEFEKHAGCDTKHRNNNIYFPSGKSLYSVVQELKVIPQNDLLFEAIQTASDLDRPSSLIEFHETTEGITPKARAEPQVERRQTNIVAGGSALRPKELLTLVKPAGEVLSPVKLGKLQSGVLRGSGGGSRVGRGQCDCQSRRECSGIIAGGGSVFPGQELPKFLAELVLIGLHRPEHLPELVLVGLHSFDLRSGDYGLLRSAMGRS